jgi:CspA family cold shock protein
VKKKKFSTEVIPTGRAKSFSDQKVYGFIEIEGGKDVFAHHSSIQGEGLNP